MATRQPSGTSGTTGTKGKSGGKHDDAPAPSRARPATERYEPGPMAFDEIVVPDVSSRDIQKLEDRVHAENGTITGAVDGDGALVQMDCFMAKAFYDRPARALVVEPLRLMPNLKPRRLRRIIEHMLAPPEPLVTLESGQEVYKPTPYECAVYNWVVGFITNRSGGALTYSGQQIEHGVMDVKVTKIAPGDSPDTHSADGYFQCSSGKDSGLGCKGSISYGLADGVTTLTIYFELNTLTTKKANAALSGQNASRYKVSSNVQDKFYSAAAYAYPYVDLDKD